MNDVFINIFEWFPLIAPVPYFLTYYCVQAYRMFKRKSSDDISLFASWVAFLTTVACTVYGFFFSTWQYVASCLIGDVGWLVVIVLTVKYRTQRRK